MGVLKREGERGECIPERGGGGVGVLKREEEAGWVY